MSQYPKFTQKCYCEETLDSMISSLEALKENVLGKEIGLEFSFFNLTILEALERTLVVAENFVTNYMKTETGEADDE